MSRAVRAMAAPLALATLLLCGDLAGADPPAPSGAAAVQIGQAGTPQSDTGAVQLSGHPPRAANAAGVSQLTPATGQPTAPAQITRPAAGRNTQVSAVAGHDRCDPASPEAKAPECARIPENRPDDFQAGPTDATTNTVDPNAPSQDLVNGILSGGTGTVVQLPPK
jgi:hypothetical protein